MDMKKFLQAVDGVSDAAPKAESTDMKKFLSVVTEGARPDNRLTMAEQTIVQHYTPVQEKDITPQKSRPSLISKYVESVEQEIEDNRSKKSSALSKKVMEQMYPDEYIGQKSQLDKHIQQSQRPDASVVKRAKAGAAHALGHNQQIGESDNVDTVTVDIPLLIRLLEYAREDAKTDMDLHRVSENLIELSKNIDVLSMDQYEEIVGNEQSEVTEDVEEFVLYVNGKPASKYEDEHSAKRDIAIMKKSHPGAKIILKKEVCSQELVSEVSTELLGRYKKAASTDASKADAEGNFERGNKRFSGIVKATKKQFDNDLKSHKKSS